MNRKLPYEKIISEKLQHLNLPDPEITWKQMNQKLDEALPLSNSSEKPAKRTGWWVGLSGILIIAGIWAVNQLNNTISNDTKEILPSAQDNTNIRGSGASADAIEINPDNKTREVSNNRAEAKSINDDFVTKKEVALPAANAQKELVGRDMAANYKQETVTSTEVLPELPGPVTAGLAPEIVNMNTGKSTIESTGENKNIHINGELPVTANHILKGDNAPSSDDGIPAPAANYTAPSENTTNKAKQGAAGLIASVQTLKNTIADYSTKESIPVYSPDKNNELTVAGYVSTLPDVRAQKKLILREMRKSERKEERELSKSYRTYQSFWGESPDRWFAAGIAPYQNIAIANQQPYHFNSSAGRNIIPDYIPSPYLQFHVTNRVYLQSEFQFNAPQSTPSLLMSQRNFAVPSGNLGYAENVYLRKLYYFNMPVSFYYSPVKNFYIGSGLQFSSFNSGLAEVEQRSSGNTILNSTTIKLKDDSLSAKITGSEWRYLFDANYYVNRFMFGVRYNQALNSFINLRINNILPPTQARNQAVQIYLRYNLIVSDKKSRRQFSSPRRSFATLLFRQQE